jgi:hypothetical protein
MILSLLKFLQKFISTDLHIIKEIGINYFNITNLVTLIYENNELDSIKILSNDVKVLHDILFTHIFKLNTPKVKFD